MFSIIVPLYNKAHTIERTISSVLDQTYQKFEIVIIDDGSTDNGVEVINKLFSDNRIRIISQANQGVSAARNTGIINAKNEWISFLDGDDEWLPDYLENVFQTISLHQEARLVIMGRYGQNIITGVRKSAVPERYLNTNKIIDFFHNPHVFAHISATTVKRQLLIDNFDTFGSFVEGQKSNEDFTFLFRVALHAKTAYCGKPLAIYNGGIEGQATSTLNINQKLKDSVLFHNCVIQEYEKSNSLNSSFVVFMKYELRHILFTHLKLKEYNCINYYIKNLDTCYTKKKFQKNELYFLSNKKFNFVMQVYIILTKIRWRLRGYPKVTS